MIQHPRRLRFVLQAAALSAAVTGLISSHSVQAALEPPIIPTVHPTLSPTSAIPVSLIVRADNTSTWKSNLEQRLLSTGRVVIDIGYRTLRADNAAIWLTPSREAGENTFDVAIYLSGKARVTEGDGSKNTNSTGDELLVTTRISRSVQLINPPVAKAEEDSTIVKRGEELRQELLNRPKAPMHIPHLITTSEEEALQSGWIAKGPNNRIIAGPGEVQIVRNDKGEIIRVQPGNTAPKTMKPRPEILATGDLFESKRVNGEIVTTIRGAYLLANLHDGKPPMEFHAQRMILFSPEQKEGEPKPAVDKDNPITSRLTGAYLEGDVTLDMGAQTIRAERLYYDFTSQRAIMLDATLTTFDEIRKIPLYMRAAEIRRLSRSEFAAKKATFSSSEFATPHYHIGASEMYLQDITPEDDKGKPMGLPVYGFRAKGDTINIRGVPVFYWPYLAGDTSKTDIPLRRIKFGNSSTYGLSLQTDWDLFSLAGQKEPKGVHADLNLDYFGKRGPATGVQATWEGEDYHGLLRSYILNDQGSDRLGFAREDVKAQEDLRDRFTVRHQQKLGDGWSMNLEASYISDPNFLEQFFRNEFETDKEQETSIYLKKQGETDALTFLGKFSLFDFTATADRIDDQYTVQKLPEMKYWRIGDSFLDMFTYYSETSASNLNANITNFTPSQLGLFPSFVGTPARFVPLNVSYRDYYKRHGYTDDSVLRGDTRQEIDMPLQIGDLKLTPYLVGRMTAWDDAFPSSESGDTTRLWGQAGVRGSMAFWKVYDNVNSTFWDIHNIRHIIEPQFHIFATGSTTNREELQLFDRDDEGISNASGASFALNQKWQTKRGGPGNWRNVDWLVLNVQVNQFWNEDDPSFINPLNPLRGFLFPSRPELSLARNSVAMDGVWRFGERARLVGELNYSTDENRIEQFATGLVVDQTSTLSWFVGNRYVQALNTDEWTVGMDYQLTKKYQLIASESYDFQNNHNILSSFTLIRKLPRFNVALTLTYDVNQDDTSVVVNMWPEGFADLGLGNRGGGGGGPGR